jgi:hypothetical protein
LKQLSDIYQILSVWMIWQFCFCSCNAKVLNRDWTIELEKQYPSIKWDSSYFDMAYELIWGVEGDEKAEEYRKGPNYQGRIDLFFCHDFSEMQDFVTKIIKERLVPKDYKIQFSEEENVHTWKDIDKSDLEYVKTITFT